MAGKDKAPRPARRTNPPQRAGRAAAGSPTPGGPRTATVDLPFVTAEFRLPDVTRLSVPGVGDGDVDMAVRLVRSYLPPPQQAAYYACLGVLGVLQMVEWPVVVAIGAGTALSRQVADGRTSQSI